MRYSVERALTGPLNPGQTVGAGDWRSGSASASHAEGHWFDPSIAHVERELCGKWMPRKQTYCARGAGHPPPCATPEAMERQRQRAEDSRPARVVTPESKARWNRANKFVRLGIHEEEYNLLMEAQGYACAMCRQPFGETRDTLPQVDHDHDCCPPYPTGHVRSCGKCIRRCCASGAIPLSGTSRCTARWRGLI